MKREFVRARVAHYVAAHTAISRRGCGNSPLVSLDEMLFDVGATTRGDTVSRGFGTRRARRPQG
jgi:hypothetical protein